MNNMYLRLSLDLDVGFFADRQVLEFKECSLPSFHAGYEALDLLVLIADVVLELWALVEVGGAVVWGEGL